MVYVFPLPVCPYAKMVTLNPSIHDVTNGFNSLNTCT